MSRAKRGQFRTEQSKSSSSSSRSSSTASGNVEKMRVDWGGGME